MHGSGYLWRSSVTFVVCGCCWHCAWTPPLRTDRNHSEYLGANYSTRLAHNGKCWRLRDGVKEPFFHCCVRHALSSCVICQIVIRLGMFEKVTSSTSPCPELSLVIFYFPQEQLAGGVCVPRTETSCITVSAFHQTYGYSWALLTSAGVITYFY